MRERTDAMLEGDPLPVERYRFADEVLRGKRIADACCGLGYGTAMLAVSRTVLGVDFDHEAIAYAREHYPGLYVVANVEVQTFAGFDGVVCLEAISHMVDPYTWIKNLAVPEVVISMPLTPSKSWYPWRKHEIPAETLVEMFTPKWRIGGVLNQERPESGTRYLTVHAADPKLLESK